MGTFRCEEGKTDQIIPFPTVAALYFLKEKESLKLKLHLLKTPSNAFACASGHRRLHALGAASLIEMTVSLAPHIPSPDLSPFLIINYLFMAQT